MRTIRHKPLLSDTGKMYKFKRKFEAKNAYFYKKREISFDYFGKFCLTSSFFKKIISEEKFISREEKTMKKK